jgi:non-specific serine/threonine protein kinase
MTASAHAAKPDPSALAVVVFPSGHLHLRAATAEDEGGALRADHPAALAAAGGAGALVLHLGAAEPGSALPPPFAYLRELGHELVARLCAHADLETSRGALRIDPPRDRLEALALAPPPFAGAEYVTADVLAALWSEANDAFAAAMKTHRGPVADWLRAKSPVWATVGRVHFHLAENKRDPDAPFAFLATYTTGVAGSGKAQHRPLGHALEEYRAARDKDRLLALLLPVQRAAEKSALVRGMVDRGEVYQPYAWTPREAHDFLMELPALESSGVVVRVPDWWKAKRPPRAEVSVKVGAGAPSRLGTEAVLDFDASLAIDGEPLTAEERAAILSSTSGLVFIKGKWVEADGEKLREVLAQWKKVERRARDEGLGFHEAMRMLTGSALADDAAATLGDEARSWSRVEPGPWMGEVLEGLRAPDALAPIDPGGDLAAVLRPYQRAGVSWLAFAHDLGLGVCLADDMGLGKTLQVLSLLLVRRARTKEKTAPALLVVPASLVANWKSEAERFTPTLRVLVAHAASLGAGELASITSADIDAADAVITTYGSVARLPWIAERAWGMVVLDEAQAIKNPAAKTTRAVKALKARARLALTGTPVENRLGDLWSIFDFLSPGLLGDAKGFGRATKAMREREGTGYAPLRALLRPYILRRMKTDRAVIADLPDKTEVTAFAPLSKVQATLYEQAVAELRRVLEGTEGIERRGAILAALLRFKQICNHPSHYLGNGAWDEPGSGKLGRLREICEPIAARGEKVLVFTQFREATAPLAGFLEGVFGRAGLVLHGAVAVKQRKTLVDAFQDEAGPPFFVLSLKAGGTGLTLTAASHVVHFDRWWNPAVENQATDRAFRIGQKRNVLVHKLVCRGTVEERIDRMLVDKRALADAVVGEESAGVGLTELSNDEVMRLVSLDLAAAMREEG